MDVPKNETPESVKNIFEIVLGYISLYGWHLLFFLVIANLVYSHIRPKIEKWKKERRDRQEAAEYSRDPEKLLAMQEALARSRQKMQEEHDQRAREQAEKVKQMEEEKRKEKIKKWQCVQTGSSFSAENKTAEGTINTEPRQRKIKPEEPSLQRQAYNPLMGSGGGSSGYRPSRRGGGGSAGG